MKKFWKALGLAALAAAVPVRVKKDDTTGRKQYQSLLLSVDVGPGEDGEGTGIDINFGEGIINSAITGAVNAKLEASLFTDDPEEAVLFADSDPITETENVSPAYDWAEKPAAETDDDGPVPVEDEEAAAEQSDGSAVTEDDFDPDL